MVYQAILNVITKKPGNNTIQNRNVIFFIKRPANIVFNLQFSTGNHYQRFPMEEIWASKIREDKVRDQMLKCRIQTRRPGFYHKFSFG